MPASTPSSPAAAPTPPETALAGLDRAFHVAPAAMALISAEGRLVRVNRTRARCWASAPTSWLGA